MPIFHQYQGKSGWFVRTAIQNAIITFQLTATGAKRLLEAGIKDGSRFRRAILFGLYRTGDAYTHGTGPGVIEPYKKGQLEIDFSNDPEPETIFPFCSSCGSLADLHLVEVKQESKHYATLHCPSCRGKHADLIDASIPLPLTTRGVLEKVLELKGIRELDKTTTTFRESLDRAFIEKWGDLAKMKAKTRGWSQGVLIAGEDKQRKLPHS